MIAFVFAPALVSASLRTSSDLLSAENGETISGRWGEASELAAFLTFATSEEEGSNLGLFYCVD